MPVIELNKDFKKDDVNTGLHPVNILAYKVGKNGNDNRMITLECGVEMAKTLRGAPIVGAFDTEKDDFTDHGLVLEIRGEEITFKNLAVPYGFIPLDAEINLRTMSNGDQYIEILGYVWYKQYPQLSKILDGDRPVSITLFDEPFNGHWEENWEENTSFYVITEATIENVCILGEDVIPSFEEASISGEKQFTVAEKNFKKDILRSFAVLNNKKSNEKGDNIMLTNNTNESTNEPKKDFSVELNTKEKEIVSLKENLETKEKEFVALKEEKENLDKEFTSLKENFETKEKEFAALKEEKENLEKEIAELKSFKEETIKAQKEDVVKEFTTILDEGSLKNIELDKFETAEDVKKELSFLAYTSGAFAKEPIKEDSKVVEEAVEEKTIKTFNVSSVQPETDNNKVEDWAKLVLDEQNN